MNYFENINKAIFLAIRDEYEFLDVYITYFINSTLYGTAA